MWRYIITGCGLALIVLTLSIGAFLCYKGVGTFTTYNHSIAEFLFSADWAPSDSAEGGGSVGAAIFIFGSVITCALALAIATPFSLATAIFMTEISPELGKRFVQPAVEIFVGIPSVVYAGFGLTILVPLIKNIFNLRFGFSVLAAGIVLAVMIFPTITSLAADALRSIPKSYRAASYGLGATRWQTIAKVVVPAAVTGLMTAVILGLARAFGEALEPEYKTYQAQVKANAAAMAKAFMDKGYKIISDGTDNHSMLIDLRKKFPELTGKVAEKALVAADITVNKNMVPFDSRSAFQTSGIRVGTPATHEPRR